MTGGDSATTAPRPILVTGSHRSGSTWTGQVLAAAPHAAYVHEPFNQGLRINHLPGKMSHLFEYVVPEENPQLQAAFARVVQSRYPFFKNFVRARTPFDVAKLCRDQLYAWIYRFQGRRLVLKDPHALFAVEWIERECDCLPLILIRHPAAFCSSLKIKNWTFDFNDFRSQPHLMDDLLSDYRDEIDRFSRHEFDIIDQAILLWNCFHHVIDSYRRRFPHWRFERHEDLSLDPQGVFREIFNDFDLEFSTSVRRQIEKTTGQENPTEQNPDNEFIRNSRKNIWNWQHRLTDEEISRIRARTQEISPRFYSDEDWDR